MAFTLSPINDVSDRYFLNHIITYTVKACRHFKTNSVSNQMDRTLKVNVTVISHTRTAVLFCFCCIFLNSLNFFINHEMCYISLISDCTTRFVDLHKSPTF